MAGNEKRHFTLPTTSSEEAVEVGHKSYVEPGLILFRGDSNWSFLAPKKKRIGVRAIAIYGRE